MKDRGETRAARADAETFEIPEDFWDDAEITPPMTKRQVNLRVDPDIVDFFKDQGPGHLTRMHAVLRSYGDAQIKLTDGSA